MHGVATEKVAGGKLLRVKVDCSDVIKHVSITGDFFLHPEEGIEKIESAIFGLNVNDSEEKITDIIKEVIEENGIELIGIDAEAIARNIKAAMKSDV
jgi:lipoate-protein ligase A